MSQAWQEHLTSLNAASAGFLSENRRLTKENQELKKAEESWRNEKLDLVTTQGELLDKLDVQQNVLEELKLNSALEQAQKKEASNLLEAEMEERSKIEEELDQVKKEISHLRAQLKGKEEEVKRLELAYQAWVREEAAARKAFEGALLGGIVNDGRSVEEEKVGGAVGVGGIPQIQSILNLEQLNVDHVLGAEDERVEKENVETSDDSSDGENPFIDDNDESDEDMDNNDDDDDDEDHIEDGEEEGDNDQGMGESNSEKKETMTSVVTTTTPSSSSSGRNSIDKTDDSVIDSPQSAPRGERIFGSSLAPSITGAGTDDGDEEYVDAMDGNGGLMQVEGSLTEAIQLQLLSSSSVGRDATSRKRGRDEVDGFEHVGRKRPGEEQFLKTLGYDSEDPKEIETQSDSGTMPGDGLGTWRESKSNSSRTRRSSHRF